MGRSEPQEHPKRGVAVGAREAGGTLRAGPLDGGASSGEGRVGEEGRCRGGPEHLKKKKNVRREKRHEIMLVKNWATKVQLQAVDTFGELAIAPATTAMHHRCVLRIAYRGVIQIGFGS